MWRNAWVITKTATNDFFEHDVLTKAAALALYSVLGLAPTILLVLVVMSWVGPGTDQAVIRQVESMVGSQAARGIADVVKSAREEQSRQASGTFSAFVGLMTILFSVTGIFAQLQASLNDIWGVKPSVKGAFWSWLRARLLSFGLLLSILFLLLVSLILNAGIAMVLDEAARFWAHLNLVVSLLVNVALFAMVFRVLPDVRIRWRDLWLGATLTAVLFAIGKHVIGLYLGHSAVTSSYGAAGSLVALIVWVYYSAIIVFVGAEVTQAYVHCRGCEVKTTAYAVPKDDPAVRQAKAPT